MRDNGAILVCQPDGTLREVVRCRTPAPWQVGKPFDDYLESGSHAKFERFLNQVLAEGVATGWEFIASVDREGVLLELSGLLSEDNILLVVAVGDPETAPCLDALSELNNEQATELRFNQRALHHERQAGMAFSAGLIDELTNLNNELATMQRALAQKNAALQRANEQMNRFLGIAAHDLRNPLGVIRNFAELLLEDQVSEDQAHGLEAIHHSAGFMQRLVDDLLDTAQLDAGKIVPEMAAVESVAFVASLAARMRPFAEAKRIRLELIAPEPPQWIQADAVRLEQVLANLVTNAFKFSPSDTQVSVSWERGPGEVAIAVTDQGLGIPAAELGKLFEPFARTSVRPTGGESSTGLGLWIARRSIEAQGGRMEVSSEVGRGTCFKVWLKEGP